MDLILDLRAVVHSHDGVQVELFGSDNLLFLQESKGFALE